MWITWYVFGIVQIGLTRWFKHVSDWNSYIHTFLGWFIVTVTIWSVAALLIDTHQARFGELTKGSHSILGFIVFASTFFFMFAGIGVFVIRKLLKWDTRSIILVRRMHRNSAITVWILGQVANYFGIRNYLEAQATYDTYIKYKSLPLISLLTGFGVFIIFEVVF